MYELMHCIAILFSLLVFYFGKKRVSRGSPPEHFLHTTSFRLLEYDKFLAKWNLVDMIRFSGEFPSSAFISSWMNTWTGKTVYIDKSAVSIRSRSTSNCNLVMCHAIILSTICQCISGLHT